MRMLSRDQLDKYKLATAQTPDFLQVFLMLMQNAHGLCIMCTTVIVDTWRTIPIFFAILMKWICNVSCNDVR